MKWRIAILGFVLGFYAAGVRGWGQSDLSPSGSERAAAMEAYLGGNYREAETLSRRYLETQPRDSEMWGTLGNIYFGEGKMREAEEAYRKALAIEPSAVLWQVALGELFLTDGKLLKAKGQFENILQSKPDLFRAKADLCSIYVALGEHRKCRSYILDVKIEEVEDLQFCILRATYHMKQREFEEAGHWIDRALEIAPRRADLSGLKYMNDYEVGRLVLDEIRKPEKGVKSSLTEHYRKATLLLEGGNIEQAQKKIRWLMRYYPDNTELRLMNAVCEAEKGHLDSAIKEMDAITKLKIDQMSIIDDAQEFLKEAIRQREFEKRVKANDWAQAEKVTTKYFDVYLNIAAPYHDEILNEVDRYFDLISEMIAPLFESSVQPLPPRMELNVYADKESFRREAYDYYFSDAILFEGVYTKETHSIYYHLNEDLKVSGVVHEIAHAVLNERMVNTPIWLDEGIAEYVSLKISGLDALDRKIMGKNYFRQLWEFRILPTTDAIVKKLDYSLESYTLWRGLVQFMFEFENGKYLPQLRNYIKLVSNESFVSDPFQEAFADVSEQLEKDWRKFIDSLL